MFNLNARWGVGGNLVFGPHSQPDHSIILDFMKIAQQTDIVIPQSHVCVYKINSHTHTLDFVNRR